MKRLLLLLIIGVLLPLGAHAVSAEPNVWQRLKLTDGTTVEARLVGDEHKHYWLADDGTAYVAVPNAEEEVYEAADLQAISSRALSRHQRISQQRQQRLRRNVMGDVTLYSGQKKGLVILVDFFDTKFQLGNDRNLFQRICNEQGFTSQQGFVGSVSDYFKSQSYGQFNISFDVLGPITMSEAISYYGENDESGYDLRPGELVVKACKAVDSQVNFANYDWDGDSEADMVMIIFAGRGENSGGGRNTIWPHEWTLTESDYGSQLKLDGIAIDTYAMSNELSRTGIAGIGTICHEFSHCLGLPDFYDTIYSLKYGMGSWSLMDSGNYNGNGFIPAGYTSYERMCCGWVAPQELVSSTKVRGMQPLSLSPQAYYISNDGYGNEYYLLENRQLNGWDAKLPGKGLLVIHIDYDKAIWQNNVVNSIVSAQDAAFYKVPANDHQRCTIIRASNSTNSNGSGDAYPYNNNNTLTNTSKPAATLYHNNSDGKRLMNIRLQNITQQADGTISFDFYDTAEQGPVVGIDDATRQNDKEQIENNIYDLQGRRYEGSNLPHGLYIINGKKIVR